MSRLRTTCELPCSLAAALLKPGACWDNCLVALLKLPRTVVPDTLMGDRSVECGTSIQDA
jgi:hypothetical protein